MRVDFVMACEHDRGIGLVLWSWSIMENGEGHRDGGRMFVIKYFKPYYNRFIQIGRG